MTTNVETASRRIDAVLKAERNRAERRRTEREAYQIVIHAAPYDGKTVPAHHEFRNVVTRDLSPTGISFYTDLEPSSDCFILMLGGPDRAQYLSARVIHFSQGFQDRKLQYLIGCTFTGRIDDYS